MLSFQVWTKVAFQCRTCAMICHKKCLQNCMSHTHCIQWVLKIFFLIFAQRKYGNPCQLPRLALLTCFSVLYGSFVSPCLRVFLLVVSYVCNCLYISRFGTDSMFSRAWHQLRFPALFTSHHFLDALGTSFMCPALVSGFIFLRLTIGTRTCHEFWLVYLLCNYSGLKSSCTSWTVRPNRRQGGFEDNSPSQETERRKQNNKQI